MAIREYSPTLSKTDTGCFRQQIEEPYEFVKVDRVFEELAGLRYAPFVLDFFKLAGIVVLVHKF